MSQTDWLSVATLVVVGFYVGMEVGSRLPKNRHGRISLLSLRLIMSSVAINSVLFLAKFESPRVNTIGVYLALGLAGAAAIAFVVQTSRPDERRLTSR